MALGRTGPKRYLLSRRRYWWRWARAAPSTQWSVGGGRYTASGSRAGNSRARHRPAFRRGPPAAIPSGRSRPRVHQQGIAPRCSTDFSASSPVTSGSTSAPPTPSSTCAIAASSSRSRRSSPSTPRRSASSRSARRRSGWWAGRPPRSSRSARSRDGVISDFDVTEQMIKYFVNKVHDRVGLIPRPRMLLGIPSGVTEVEKRAVRDAALNAGARWARLIEEPMAAAIGAGLPVSEPSGSLIVDIGGGTTEVAVISLGGIVVSRSIRIGGDEMDQDIVSYARREYNLFLGERTAEDIKIAIGSAYPGDWDTAAGDPARPDLLTGLPRSVEVGADEIREAIEISVRPDRRHHQGHDRGDAAGARRRHDGPGHRAGRRRGAARGPRPPRRRGTQMPVHVADDPLTCVAPGTGVVLQELSNANMERVLVARAPTAGGRADPARTLIAGSPDGTRAPEPSRDHVHPDRQPPGAPPGDHVRDPDRRHPAAHGVLGQPDRARGPARPPVRPHADPGRDRDDGQRGGGRRVGDR